MAQLQEGIMIVALFDAQVSLFRGAMDPYPFRTTTVGTVLDAIRTGVYRAPIEHLRHRRLAQGQVAYKTAKERLDAVTFGGTFAPKRSKTTLVQHSSVVHGDLDHLDDLPALKQTLCADVHTAYCFVSPGGDGLKVGVCVEPVTENALYRHAWQTVAEYFQRQHGVTWDPSGKDVCRLCFVSWDPGLYLNPDVQPFPVPPMPAPVPHLHTPLPPQRTVPRDRRDWYARRALDRATHLIEVSVPGQKHSARCKAAYLLGGYVGGGLLAYDEAYTALEAAVARTAKDVRRAMQSIQDCLEAGRQDPITATDLEQARLAWRSTPWHARARTRDAKGGAPWH
jgi:hypothetical protein